MNCFIVENMITCFAQMWHLDIQTRIRKLNAWKLLNIEMLSNKFEKMCNNDNYWVIVVKHSCILKWQEIILLIIFSVLMNKNISRKRCEEIRTYIFKTKTTKIFLREMQWKKQITKLCHKKKQITKKITINICRKIINNKKLP